MEELIKKLKSNPDFVEFTEYVLQEIENMDTVRGSTKLSRDRAGETAQSREMAMDMLYKILKPFIEFNEKKQPTESEVKKAGGRYGLI